MTLFIIFLEISTILFVCHWEENIWCNLANPYALTVFSQFPLYYPKMKSADPCWIHHNYNIYSASSTGAFLLLIFINSAIFFFSAWIFWLIKWYFFYSFSYIFHPSFNLLKKEKLCLGNYLCTKTFQAYFITLINSEIVH